MNTRSSHSREERGQFGLMLTRRFAPFFSTQFLGAFNDNVFKNALLLIIAYQGQNTMGVDANVLINLAAGLFILPFFLFSATAGQLADRYEKSALIQKIKLFEIGIMVCAALAFMIQNTALLILLLFLMGTQSAFFGPVKYSIIPQHLKNEELVGGNAMVEMGTFIAILLGTIAGGVLSDPGFNPLLIGSILCLVAVLGWISSRSIPRAESVTKELKINWNPLTETWRTIGLARKIESVYLSILGISWFWFLGAAYLTQLPNYTRDVLRGSGNVVTLLLAVFSIGIGMGSLFCERLSGRKVELGLVPLGSLGLSVFGIDLFFAYQTPHQAWLMGVSDFLQAPGGLRVIIDLVCIGIFGGFYIVPLYAFIQYKTGPEYRSRVIAANNILNALFMVVSALSAICMIGMAGLSIPQFFLVMALMNIAVAVYIYTVVPEFVVRFIIWVLTHTLYRVTHENLKSIPDQGPAVLVCNHVSYVDGLLLAGSIRRPIRFVMHEAYYRMPVIHFILRVGQAIPIASKKKNPQTFRNAFENIAQALRQGDLICIFPEGRLTPDGEMGKFRRGIEKIVRETPVPVIPLALRGLWGSFFSHHGGKIMSRPFKRFWSRIEIAAGHPIRPEDVTASGLQETVRKLLTRK